MQSNKEQQTNKSKRSNKRRNSRKKSLSPSNIKSVPAASPERPKETVKDTTAAGKKRYECKRSLSEGSAKAKHRKSNIRRTLSHPFTDVRQEVKLNKVQSDTQVQEANANNNSDKCQSQVPELCSENSDTNNKASFDNNLENENRVDSVLSDCTGENVVNDHPKETSVLLNTERDRESRVISSLKNADDSISDDSNLPLEIVSSDRDTEDELRKSHFLPKSVYKKVEYESMHEDFRAMCREGVKAFHEQWRALETVRGQEMLAESFQKSAMRYDSGSEFESRAASAVRRASFRRRRAAPDAGSGATKEDLSEVDPGRMRPEDYKLVFISSDSSSKEEENEDSSSTASSIAPFSLEDCDWDYFEPGGASGTAGGGTIPRAPPPASACGKTCSCGASPRLVHVPVPVPVPVPVALWPTLLICPESSRFQHPSYPFWPFGDISLPQTIPGFPNFNAADYSELKMSTAARSSFTAIEDKINDTLSSSDSQTSNDTKDSALFDSIDATCLQAASASQDKRDQLREVCTDNAEESPSSETDFSVKVSYSSSEEISQDPNLTIESSQKVELELTDDINKCNNDNIALSTEKSEGYLYTDKAFSSSSESAASTDDENGMETTKRSYDLTVINIAKNGDDTETSDDESLSSSDEGGTFSKVFVVNPNHSSSDVEDNADSSGSECTDNELVAKEHTLTFEEELENEKNMCMKKSLKMQVEQYELSRDNALKDLSDCEADQKCTNNMVIPYSVDIIEQCRNICDISKDNEKCADFKRFCDLNMLQDDTENYKDTIFSESVNIKISHYDDSDSHEIKTNNNTCCVSQDAAPEENEILVANESQIERDQCNTVEEIVKATAIIGNRSHDPISGFSLLDHLSDNSDKNSQPYSADTIEFTTDDVNKNKHNALKKIEDLPLALSSRSPRNYLVSNEINLLKGIERTISELLIKEASLTESHRDIEEKLAADTVGGLAIEGQARAVGGAARSAIAGGAPPVDRPRSARADRCARYTSRVMITQEPSPQVSVITSDTTRLMADVTVQHTNCQNETEKNRKCFNDDDRPRPNADVELASALSDSENSASAGADFDGGVTVVTNANTLSAVVCLEEGLADDDSWVEDVSHDEDVPTSQTESDSGEEVTLSSSMEYDDFSGYQRQALDFTLHTIVEESCEESEPEQSIKKMRPISATELEKYFFFGLGDGQPATEEMEDPVSETSSVCSEGVDSLCAPENTIGEEHRDPEELASSRLEKYFLSGFMGFTQENRDTDGSGSVGSDSEGRHSPEQRRKRLVRARGTGRSHSSSLDNLLASNEMLHSELQNEAVSDSEGSSTETDTYPNISVDKSDCQGDTAKRKKQNKKIRNSPADEKRLSLELREEVREESRSISEGEEDGHITPQPEFMSLGSDLSNSKKQTSRDSGFVGSCDDLLKNNSDASNETLAPKNCDIKPDLEEIKEENKQDLEERTDHNRYSNFSANMLVRKDSFNNWSSDEETNLMMSKMRQFFKSMVAASANAQTSTLNAEAVVVGSKPVTPVVTRPASTASPRVRRAAKPPQLVYFENELTRLMKTVPGIRDEEVKEIVEYLSSEDTWSDSYDSSDYTSSDLEGAGGRKSALQQQISESCKEIIDKFENVHDTHGEAPVGEANAGFDRDTAYVYQKLMASLSKIQAAEVESDEAEGLSPRGSPPLVAKVIKHIGSRLVALMHEVSSGESGASGTSASPRARPSRRARPASASTTEEDDGASDASARVQLPRSKSHDVLAHETQRSRGSEEREERDASDCDRFSWRGSFESALLAADSRGALAVEAASARRSAGDLLAAQRSQSRSCGAIGSEERLWRARRRSSAPDAAPEDEDDRPRATGSLPRLPSGATPVKSARYRPPGFARAQRAASAPGLHVLAPRAPRRRPVPPTTVSSPLSGAAAALHVTATAAAASAPTLQDDSFSECDGTLPRRSNSPVPTTRDHDFDRLVGLHNRSGLQARSESMASVYSGAGDGARGAVAVRGAAQFALTYNYRLGALDVNVRRCRDLAPVDAKRNRSDPYVKVYLLPDKSKCGKRKTKVKKNTLNPIFDETLRFVAPLSALGGRTLWLGVWHADMFGRNDFLGEVTLPLADLVFDDPTPKWYNLQERTEQLEEPQGSKGELIVGLMWEPAATGARGTLHVLVKEAKGLCATKPSGLADAFCKSYLLPERGRGTKQKTAVVRRSLSPRWEHSFVYRSLSLSDLQQRALELSVWDRDLLTSNDFMGGVRFSTGTGTYLGEAVDWMDSVGKEVSLWQTMMARPNFWVEGSVPLRPSLSN